MKPVRIQRKRTKGWKMPANTASVTRPGPWGNYAAIRLGQPTGQPAVDAFRTWLDTEASGAWKANARKALRCMNLMCWCKPDEPCHADVLLEFVNT